MTCTPWIPPTIAQFKAQFYRDFPFAPSPLENDTSDTTLRKYVVDPDIQNAINLAQADFNPVYGTDTTLIFLYLAAHYLIIAIRDSSMGLNSQSKFMLDASSVGGVSITNDISQKFKDDPNFSKYLKTGKGQIYLDLVYPYTIGAGFRFIGGGVSTN